MVEIKSSPAVPGSAAFMQQIDKANSGSIVAVLSQALALHGGTSVSGGEACCAGEIATNSCRD